MEPGFLVFWASYDGGSGLFSWKDGTVKTILPEGETVTSPNFRPKPGLEPQKMRLHRMSHLPGWVAGAHTRTLLNAGRRLFYLTIDTSYKNTGMFQSDNSTVYAWDGEKLFPVLGKADSLPLPGGGLLSISSARVAAVGTDDKVLIAYVAKTAGQSNGWVLFDGTSLTPVLSEGDPLQGLPGIKVQDTNPPHRFDWGWLNWLTAWRSPETTIGVLDVAGAPYKRALFRLGKGGAEKLLAEGDPDPTDSTKKIKEIIRIEVGAPDAVAVLIGRSTWSGDLAWLLYQAGGFRRMLDKTLIQRPDPSWDSVGFGQAVFLQADPPRFLFQAFIGKLETSLQTRGQMLYLVGKTQLRGDWYIFEGEKASRLNLDGTPLALRVLGGERPGVILSSGIAGAKDIVPEALSLPSSIMTHWFIDTTAKESTAAAPPVVTVAGDRQITFAHVLGWRRPSEAVVWQQDGFFLVTK